MIIFELLLRLWYYPWAFAELLKNQISILLERNCKNQIAENIIRIKYQILNQKKENAEYLSLKAKLEFRNRFSQLIGNCYQ